MRKHSPEKRIRKLLDALKEDFPRRKAAIEQVMKEHGLNESIEFKFMPAEDVQTIPTFARKKSYPTTPLLRARFEYASTMKYATDTWLSVRQMQRWMRKKEIRSYHKSLRENWEASAPMCFRDDQLTLIEVTEGVPDNLTYLVWCHGEAEPEIWSYRGFDSNRFTDLEDYLIWCLRQERANEPN
jgi:hypothetical protein